MQHLGKPCGLRRLVHFCKERSKDLLLLLPTQLRNVHLIPKAIPVGKNQCFQHSIMYVMRLEMVQLVCSHTTVCTEIALCLRFPQTHLCRKRGYEAILKLDGLTKRSLHTPFRNHQAISVGYTAIRKPVTLSPYRGCQCYNTTHSGALPSLSLIHVMVDTVSAGIHGVEGPDGRELTSAPSGIQHPLLVEQLGIPSVLHPGVLDGVLWRLSER